MEKKQNWYVNKKKYHFIYKTTCKINSKYYLGMHSTDNLEDGYIGSGTRLWHSIKKHGRENFSFEILEFLADREALRNREAELINEEKLKDPMCMNLTLGGEGDWYHCNSNSELQRKKSIKGNAKMKQLRETDEAWKQKKHDSHSKTLIKDYKEGTRVVPEAFRLSFLGKTHTQETKDKIGRINSENQSGTKNSRFGSVWVYSDLLKKSKSISKELVSTLGSDWKLGRKMKFDISFV